MNQHQREIVMAGARHWFETWPARWAAMTPEQRAAHTAERARINAEVDAHIAWLDWCAENKKDPNTSGLGG